MPTETAQDIIWTTLANHINENFYRLDLEALRAIFSAVHAHYGDEDPVWVFNNAPSGSGKTSVTCNCLSGLPLVEICSDLTPKSFLVGTEDEYNERSLLNRKSMILVFKDFTTILSKREEDQKEIIGNFREVYDGQFKKKTAKVKREWHGKCTVIAAVTPSIERAWSVHRDLGERFCQVRWANSHDPTKVAKMARAQQGREKEISRLMREFTLALFEASDGNPPAFLSDKDGDRVDAAASLVAKLRAHIVRDSASRQIIDIAPPEEPTRLAKSTASLAQHHAALFGRDVVTSRDMLTAMRMITDTIPSSRMKIIEITPPDASLTITTADIRELTGLHKNTVLWQTDELEALGVVKIGKNLNDERTVSFTSEFADLWVSFIA